MCGITGFWDLTKSKTNGELTTIVTGMRDSMRHRGPDDHGEWVDQESGIALGFRRLAILDLSPTGHQPMLSWLGEAGQGGVTVAVLGSLDEEDAGVLRRVRHHTGAALAFSLAVDGWSAVVLAVRIASTLALS